MTEKKTQSQLQDERFRMVQDQIVRRGIHDKKVLEVLRKIQRHLFLPESLWAEAYDDNPLSIGWNQTISQPYIVALMTELLKLDSSDRVLEIGTGSGYQTAVLADIASEVFTVEVLEPLQQTAKHHLQELGYQNIFFRLGDGHQGWPEEAPFDKIMVTAAAGDHIPKSLREQLKEGGILVIPVGQFNQMLIVGVKHHGSLETTETIPVRFVPLV